MNSVSILCLLEQGGRCSWVWSVGKREHQRPRWADGSRRWGHKWMWDVGYAEMSLSNSSPLILTLLVLPHPTSPHLDIPSHWRLQPSLGSRVIAHNKCFHFVIPLLMVRRGNIPIIASYSRSSYILPSLVTSFPRSLTVLPCVGKCHHAWREWKCGGIE